MASAALTDFLEGRLPDVRALVARRPRRRGSALLLSPKLQTAARAVNKASIVILVAHLEGFVEDLIGNVIDELHRQLPATSDVPRVLLAEHVLGDINIIAAMTDRERRADRIADLFASRAGLWLSQTLVGGSLNAEVIAAKLGNPGAKELGRVMGLLGISEIFTDIILPDGGDPARRINEIVGIRNAIAHGVETSVTDDDITQYVDSVEAIGIGLDAVASRHVKIICQSATLPW